MLGGGAAWSNYEFLQLGNITMIYKKVILENSDPWPSQLPSCKCHESGNGRIILYEGKLYCGRCGIVYGAAGSVGLALVEEVTVEVTV